MREGDLVTCWVCGCDLEDRTPIYTKGAGAPPAEEAYVQFQRVIHLHEIQNRLMQNRLMCRTT